MQHKVYLLDLAIMANRAYQAGQDQLSPGWKEEPAQQYEAGSKDYRILPFVDAQNKIVVLANRGTASILNLPNLFNDDLRIALGKLFPYYRFSFDTANFFREKYKGYSIVHTGHSLGGATATLVAATTGESAVVFDSPGVKEIIDGQPELERLIKKDANITIYQSEPNIVNTCGSQYPPAKVVPIKHCSEVKTKLAELKQKNAHIDYTLASHSLDNMILSLKQSAMETYTIKSGDSLSSIAKNHYGIASEWKRLHEANQGVLGGNPNLIKPGQTIQIKYYTPKT